ncbi:MAG: S-layer homology domain-containing protein [Clostridia bacterium]|nr:S-layer homology domain-containing protein [Clostridia bacterium]
MTKKRFNYKYILFAIVCITAFILSIFGLKTVDTVKADEVTNAYYYKGSSLFVPYWSNTSSDTSTDSENNEKGFLDFSIDFQPSQYNSSIYVIKFNIRKFYEDDSLNGAPYSSFIARPSQGPWLTATPIGTPNCVELLALTYAPIVAQNNELGQRCWIGDVNYDSSVSGSQYFNQCYIGCNTHDFIPAITQIRIGNYPVSEITGSLYQPNFSYFDYVNYIQYVDINGNWFHIMFPSRSTVPVNGYSAPLVFSNRTYLTNLFLESDSNYNLGYDEGYKDGFSDYPDSPEYSQAIDSANKSGLSQGYENGFNAYPNSQDYKNAINSASQSGFTNGYTKGLNEGLTLSEEDYNFTRAVSTLMGAPIDVTSRMLNFNLLGVNVWVLVSALFTLVLIIRLIKIFI